MIEDIKKIVNSEEYDFLRTNEHLKDRICILGLGGSYAYGMQTDSSDIDIRGVALNSKEEILTNKNFEQFVNEETDTTIYSVNKIVSLLSNCNPNTIEIFGLKPEHYLYISPVGQMLLNNKILFLSKKCIGTFGGYANSQLRRLESKAAREIGQAQREEYILNSIKFAEEEFRSRYPDGKWELYIDDSDKEDYDTEIFINVELNHWPLRDFKNLWNEYHSIVSGYDKIGKRNQHAMVHEKIGKHMAHLIRLYCMCFDILEKGEIITYREDEHDLLMSIRNGEWLDENKQPIPKFYKLVDSLEKRLQSDAENTKLPSKPDYDAINKMLMNINERIVKGDIC